MAALKVLGGPEGYERKAWRWALPQPRKRALKDFCIGYLLDTPMASPTSEVRPLLERTISVLERAGAQLRSGWPRKYRLDDAFKAYMFLLGAFTFSVEGKRRRRAIVDGFGRIRRIPLLRVRSAPTRTGSSSICAS
jgi:Asp-tRNA(Asn)/Glu-tRNA(Gln) amidotransferase A subunit family amidase